MDSHPTYGNDAGPGTPAQVSKDYNPDVKKDQDALQVMDQELSHPNDYPLYVTMEPDPSHVQPLPGTDPSTFSASPVLHDANADARDSSARIVDDAANTASSQARWEAFVDIVSQATPLDERPLVNPSPKHSEDEAEKVDAAKTLLRMHIEDAMLSWEKWGLTRGDDLGESTRRRGENEEGG